MIWPTADRKFGWFVEPTYSYSFAKGHEQAIAVTTGLIIALHESVAGPSRHIAPPRDLGR
jgi:hypothetical protein